MTSEPLSSALGTIEGAKALVEAGQKVLDIMEVLSTKLEKGKVEKAVEVIRQAAIDEVVSDVETIKKVNPELWKEMKSNPSLTLVAVSDYAKESFGASEPKRNALRRTTLRRWDPSFTSSFREMWFKMAAQLEDHEVGALLTLKAGMVVFRHDGAYRPYPDWVNHINGLKETEARIALEKVTIKWTNTEMQQHQTAMLMTEERHPKLVSSSEHSLSLRQVTVPSRIFNLTIRGALLVEAMTAYETELGPVSST